MHSYTLSTLGLAGRSRELMSLARPRDVGEHVRTLVARLRDVEDRVREHCGVELRGLRMLDIAPGQKLLQMQYFTARGNEVTGVDLDVISQGWNPLDYARMTWQNGPVRALKTAGRKLLGIDAAYRDALEAQLGHAPRPRLDVRQMDATRLALEPASFDFVYSFSALEHFPEPGLALDEALRVLRPGGALYLSLHLWTSESGAHDARILQGRRGAIPWWAHLRPAQRDQVSSNVYVNKVRLAEWRDLFEGRMRGAKLHALQYGADKLRPRLDALRDAGELAEYSDEELLTVDLAVVWQKPAA